MRKDPIIAVFCGGTSAEREVSLGSGKACAQALARSFSTQLFVIDECGLKGARVGGAEVSPLHANFIVNLGPATAGDVLELVRRVRARVRQLKGVDLEPEVLLYGKNWKDVL